jgi:hypothetical protein
VSLPFPRCPPSCALQSLSSILVANEHGAEGEKSMSLAGNARGGLCTNFKATMSFQQHNVSKSFNLRAKFVQIFPPDFASSSMLGEQS